jgi:hypothetical protein
MGRQNSNLRKIGSRLGPLADWNLFKGTPPCDPAVDNDTQPMESLSETKWDVVIAGTGLAQSLLALSVL